MSEPLKNLTEAVIEVMGEMESLPKDGVNSFQNYNYTTEAMVANTIRPLLVKNGLAMIPHNISVTDSQPTGKFNKSIISATYLLLHKSGESVTVTVPGEGMDSLDKSTTKALTAAFKYALLQMFCVGRGDDADAGMPDRQVNDEPRQTENSAVRAASRPAAPSSEFVLTFGKHKDSPISTVPADYLKWLMDNTEKQMLDPAKANFKAKNKIMLDAILNEIQRRASNASEPFHDENEMEPPF